MVVRASDDDGDGVGDGVGADAAGDVEIADEEDKPAGAGAAAADVVEEGLNVPAAVASIAVGLAIKYLVPCPAPLDPQAWSLLAIFMSTVTGEVHRPFHPSSRQRFKASLNSYPHHLSSPPPNADRMHHRACV